MVELTAERGKSIRLHEAREGRCDCCGQGRDVAGLQVLNSSGVHVDRLEVCGRCVTAALAVRFAARSTLTSAQGRMRSHLDGAL